MTCTNKAKLTSLRTQFEKLLTGPGTEERILFDSLSEDLKLPTGEQLLLSEATGFFDKLHQTETVANVKKAVENARKTYANNMVKFLNAEIAKTGPDELFLMADNVVLAKEFDNPED